MRIFRGHFGAFWTSRGVLAGLLCGLCLACAAPAKRADRAPLSGEGEPTQALPPDDVIELIRKTTLRPLREGKRDCLRASVERELLLRSVAGRRRLLPLRIAEPAGARLESLRAEILREGEDPEPLDSDAQRFRPARFGGEMVPGARELVLDFERAGPGDRLRVSYQRTRCQRPLGETILLQAEYPVLKARLTLVEPPGWTLRWRNAGSGSARAPEPVTKARKGGGQVRIFEMSRISPLRSEPFAAPRRMEAARVDVAILTAPEGGEHAPLADWPAVGTWLREAWAPQLLLTKDAVPRELRRKRRAAQLIDWVQRNVATAQLPLTLVAPVPAAPAEVLAAGQGAPHDKVALSVALLRQAGLQAWPAVLGTAKGDPLVAGFPRAFGHDHALVALRQPAKKRRGKKAAGDRWQFFDPSAPPGTASEMPAWTQGLSAIIVDTPALDEEAKADTDRAPPLLAVPFDAPTRNRTRATARLRLTDDGYLDGTLELTLEGQRARVLRRTLPGRDRDAQRRAFVAALWPDAEPGFLPVQKIAALRGLEGSGKLTAKLRVSVPAAVSRGGRLSTINPGLAIAPLPPGLQLRQRYSSLLLPFGERVELRVDIDLPRGTKAELPPEPVKAMSPHGSGELSWTQKGHTLRLDGFWERPAQFVPPLSYLQFRAFVDTIRQGWLREVVLRG